MKKLIKLLNNYIKNYRIEKRYKKEHKEFIESFPFIRTEKEYKNIMNKDYKNMSDLEKEQVTQYIGIQCSSFTTNSYWVRASSQDTERHLRKKQIYLNYRNILAILHQIVLQIYIQEVYTLYIR